MTELDKYQGIYSSGAIPKYGHSNHGSRAMGILQKWLPTSLLDVGCGYNEFVQGFHTACPEVRAIGVDFACPGADLIAPVTQLPYRNKEWDVVTSFDMLEHLTSDEVDTALAEMARVSSRFIVSISYVASVNKWKGENLHPTVRPEEWWITRLMRAGAIAIKKQGRYITGQWASVLRIPEEASVVLVGNGPAVLSRPLGLVIDSFDVVIRFNNYQIQGFEKHVGTKTTLWSAFFHGSSEPLRHNRIFCPHESDNPGTEAVEVYRMASHFYNRTRKQVQARAHWASGFDRDVEPLLASSGVLLTAYLLEVVGVKKVHLAGFDHFSKITSKQHHYWLPSAFKKPAEHDGDLEEVIFSEFRKAGKVTYL